MDGHPLCLIDEIARVANGAPMYIVLAKKVGVSTEVASKGRVANYSNDYDFARLIDVDTKSPGGERNYANRSASIVRDDLVMEGATKTRLHFPDRLVYIIRLLCNINARLVD